MTWKATDLDENQRVCLRLVAQGYTSKQIAQRTHLSAGTVDQYLFRANAILGVTDRREAARLLVAAESERELKQSQLRSAPVARAPKPALIGVPAVDQLARETGNFAADQGDLGYPPHSPPRTSLQAASRFLGWIGGEPHKLSSGGKLLAICWVALASGGTLSALVAIGYWLHHLFS